MENQERELGEKLASYEENLLQKVKKIILAELLGSETQPGDISGKREPRITNFWMSRQKLEPRVD
ncbi:uncharacterized protein EAE97_002274 [Botrytis byssoidea]|uniref:Uncharacterized protein n=1 Tax=Botrytis byssoidea TaxID=139641 RepID=A0A9P5IQT6_9HELO|nr:uncharacterized protein EAE97_002274 [Botrytis byssoidea]KAF7950722.1 hypothetical protein EAE97_002274 [Botrytis byssoidea]